MSEENKKSTYCHNCAIALVANRIALEYRALKAMGVSLEIETLVSNWIENNVRDYDEVFVNQVMEKFLAILKEKAKQYNG